MTSEPEVRWVYEPRWGIDRAVCWVSLGGRHECWAAQTIYITDDEREAVPQMLEAKLRRTIRLFGPMDDD